MEAGVCGLCVFEWLERKRCKHETLIVHAHVAVAHPHTHLCVSKHTATHINTQIGAGLAATALAVNLAFAQPAESVSTEQLLFLDVSVVRTCVYE